MLTGDDKQGIYEGILGGYTFVSSAGRMIYRDSFRWVFGWLDMNGTSWSFRPPTLSLTLSGDDFAFVTGSGIFSPKKSMSGKYSLGGGREEFWGPLNYSAANALAVTQGDMAGKWTTTSTDGFGMSIEVDAAGNLTGTTAGTTIGTCTVSGTLVQTEPSSSRNMFTVKLKGANAATGAEKACELDQVEEYDGLAGVVMLPASRYPEEGAYRTLVVHAVNANIALVTVGLRKR